MKKRKIPTMNPWDIPAMVRHGNVIGGGIRREIADAYGPFAKAHDLKYKMRKKAEAERKREIEEIERRIANGETVFILN